MSDRIELVGLRARGFHGVLEHERRDGQDFVVDVSLEVDTAAAAASDDLRETVDYGVLAQSIAAVIAGDPVDLLETLAQRIADVCLSDPRVVAVDVAVHKPSAPVTVPVEDVVVRIRRTAG
ncbi:MAG TPA: dihydroneopterin aldolase [Mycobacteriales bacterium]|jgi:dihydroneopterin aldolase|nr:dihydroneopterin aldolase [Mycobacteriales bacterium]